MAAGGTPGQHVLGLPCPAARRAALQSVTCQPWAQGGAWMAAQWCMQRCGHQQRRQLITSGGTAGQPGAGSQQDLVHGGPGGMRNLRGPASRNEQPQPVRTTAGMASAAQRRGVLRAAWRAAVCRTAGTPAWRATPAPALLSVPAWYGVCGQRQHTGTGPAVCTAAGGPRLPGACPHLTQRIAEPAAAG